MVDKQNLSMRDTWHKIRQNPNIRIKLAVMPKPDLGRQAAQFIDKERNLVKLPGNVIGSAGHGIRMIPGNFIAHERGLAHNSTQKMREQMARINQPTI
jgi:hypothetical protein